MQSRMLKQSYLIAIGLLLVGLLFLVAAGGGPARPDSRPNRTPHAALTIGGDRLLAPVASMTAPPTPTSAPSATPARAATLGPATPVTGASNALLAWGIVAALALVGLLNLLHNRRLRRPPPDTE